MLSPTKATFALLIAALASTLTGCLAHGHGYVGVTATARADVQAPQPPQLVNIGAGVWVVEDYDEPVYFHGDQYWVYRGGVWYRSHIHTGAWVRVNTPPAVVVRVHRPRRYVHYVGPRTARRRTIIVRDRPVRRRATPHRHYKPSKRHGRRGWKKSKKSKKWKRSRRGRRRRRG